MEEKEEIVVKSINETIALLEKEGDLLGLEKLFEEALKYFDYENEKNHIDNLNFMHNLLECKLYLEHYEGIENLIYDFGERVYMEPIQPLFQIYYFSVVSKYHYNQSRHDQALKYIQDAYDLALIHCDKKEKVMIDLVIDYVRCLYELKLYDQCLTLLLDQISSIDIGRYLDSYLLYIDTIVSVYKKKGYFTKAREYLSKLNTLIQSFDDYSVNKEIIVMHYAKHLIDINEYKQAKQVLEESYHRLNQFPNAYYLKLDVLQELSEISHIIGEKDNAAKYMIEAYKLGTELNDPYNPDFLDTALGLAYIYARNQDLTKAVELFQSVYNLCQDLYGDDNLITYKMKYIFLQHKNMIERKDDYPKIINELLTLIKPLSEDDYVEYLFKTLNTFIEQKYDITEMIQIIKNYMLTYYKDNNIPSQFYTSFAYYLKKASFIDEAKYYAYKGYIAAKNTKDVFKSILLSSLSVMIQCGFHEVEYIKEYLDLCKDELLVLYVNPNVSERNEKAEVLKEIYSIFKSSVTVDYYSDLLRYKNILFDMEYYYNYFIDYNTKTLLLEIHDFFKENGSLDITLYNQIYEEVIGIEKIRNLLYDEHMLNDIQNQLDDDECILDFYVHDYITLFIITNHNVQLLKFENQDGIKNIDLSLYHYIYICSDGYLYQYPFEEVFSQRISYLSSPKFLLHQYVNNDSNIAELIGDIDYDETYKSIHRDQYNSLVFSYYEVHKIKELFPNSQLHHKIVSKDEFMSISQPYILHVSGHGTYHNDEELSSRGSILLSDNEYVTARDIMNMNFKGTYLVSLASCYSGMGDDVNFEGVYGLRRSFELAGANAMILVKDRIYDMIAAAFMTYFYTYLKDMSISDAFYQTKKTMMNMSLHDFDQLFSLNEKIIKENKLGFYRRELYRLLQNKELLKKELNKFIIQGYVKKNVIKK